MTTKEEKELNNLKLEFLILLGNRVKKIRELKGFSQVDLASKMLGDIDTTNISRIESGRNNPTSFTLFRIAEALDVTVSELTDLSEN